MHDQGFRQAHSIRTIPQLIVDTHAPRESQEYVDEYQDIVIASATLPEEDWRRALVFKWLCQFVFFSRTLHLPILLGLRLAGLDFRATVERFMRPDPTAFPLLAELARHLFDHAEAMQRSGAPELLLSPHTRAIYWPMEQWLILDLVHRDRFDDFYREAAELLGAQVRGDDHRELIDQACGLNRALFRLPFLKGDLFWQGDFNLKELYRGILADNMPVPERGPHRYRIVRTRPEWTSWGGWHDHIQFSHLQKKHYLYGLSRV
jgi:putative methyltransferase